MRGVDLVPASRRAARQAARALRTWCAVGGVVVGVVATSCVVVGVAAAGDGQVAVDLDDAQARVKALQGSSDALHRSLVQMEVRRKAAVAANDQPDWSILLRIVARNLDAESSLRQVQLNEVTAPTVAGKPAPLRTFETRLSGYCPSPAAVSAYVLRLQQIGLFNDVALVRTARQPGGEVAFDVACTLGESMEAAR